MSYDFLSSAASWLSSLKTEAVPPDVLEKAKYQLEEVKKKISITARKLDKKITMKATAEPEFYSYKNLPRRVLERMKFDWDDFLFTAHSSHSAVLVSLAEAHKQNLDYQNGPADEKRLLCAIVAGNEVSGRIAAASLFGCQNGQAWTFCHLLSTVASVSFLRGYDRGRIRKILGIAFSQPHFALYPAFFSYAKPTAALLPINTALEALRLTEPQELSMSPAVLQKLLPDFEDSFTPPELVVRDNGFLEHFTYLPMPFFLDGLGDTWVTRALFVKKYPGCSYIENATIKIKAMMEKYRPDIKDITGVRVSTNFLTIGVENAYRTNSSESKFVTVEEATFSPRASLAVSMLSKGYELSIEALAPASLKEKTGDIRSLSEKITLSHDARKSVRILEEVNKAVSIKVLLKDAFGIKRSRDLAGSKSGRFDIGRLLKMIRENRRPGKPSLIDSLQKVIESRHFVHFFAEVAADKRGGGYSFADADFKHFSWDFDSGITITMKDGKKLSSRQL